MVSKHREKKMKRFGFLFFVFSRGNLEGCKGTIRRSGHEVGLKESLNKDSGVLGLM